nr:MAG TPA: hypothetical protein [Caudoviricetes sp.]
MTLRDAFSVVQCTRERDFFPTTSARDARTHAREP